MNGCRKTIASPRHYCHWKAFFFSGDNTFYLCFSNPIVVAWLYFLLFSKLVNCVKKPFRQRGNISPGPLLPCRTRFFCMARTHHKHDSWMKKPNIKKKKGSREPVVLPIFPFSSSSPCLFSFSLTYFILFLLVYPSSFWIFKLINMNMASSSWDRLKQFRIPIVLFYFFSTLAVLCRAVGG